MNTLKDITIFTVGAIAALCYFIISVFISVLPLALAIALGIAIFSMF